MIRRDDDAVTIESCCRDGQALKRDADGRGSHAAIYAARLIGAIALTSYDQGESRFLATNSLSEPRFENSGCVKSAPDRKSTGPYTAVGRMLRFAKKIMEEMDQTRTRF